MEKTVEVPGPLPGPDTPVLESMEPREAAALCSTMVRLTVLYGSVLYSLYCSIL
jgi:hypothetical protein